MTRNWSSKSILIFLSKKKWKKYIKKASKVTKRTSCHFPAGEHLDASSKNSDNLLESGKIEVQEKLKDQDEKRIMNNVENENIDVVKDTNSTKMGASLPE